MTTGDQKKITQCPHCGNRTPHNDLHSIRVVDEIEADGQKYDYPVDYTLWQCSTCDGVSLYLVTQDDWSNPEDDYFDVASMVYPDEKKFENVVPDSVRNSYAEAKKVKNNSSCAFAVLIRRSLEQICVDQDATGQSLKDKISDLASKDIIPKNLSRMADALRFLGNMGAHAVKYDFGWEEVRAMDDFLVAVIEYVYVAPHKVQKLAESIQAKQTSSATSPTSSSS